MSLIQSAKLNGHDPYRYLKDVLERLPTQPASRLEELLPHRWEPHVVTPEAMKGSRTLAACVLAMLAACLEPKRRSSVLKRQRYA
jgi:hypothetical protein